MMAAAASGQHRGGTKIIVNNLPRNFDDDQLLSMFSHFGSVMHAVVCMDKSTGNSLGYGFVDFARAIDAAKAIEDTNGLQLGKFKLRVAYPEPVDDSIKKATKVLVKQLPNKYDEDKIQELCSQFGKVVKVRLLRNSVTNRSNCFAIVHASTMDDAQKMVQGLNNFRPEGAKRDLKVTIDTRIVGHHSGGGGPYSNPPGAVRGRGSVPHLSQNFVSAGRGHVVHDSGPASVFVYNIGELISEYELYNVFAHFGGLMKIDIVRDKGTQMCKGYAFLTFENKKSAENAIRHGDGMMFRGRQLQVKFKR